MEKNHAKTNIVLVCWNALEYTKITLSSLFEATNTSFYLTIIDNASSDGTQDFLRELKIPSNCLELHRIYNKDNVGYGGAINQGYKISKQLRTEYTSICNNDLLFEKGWLARFEEILSNDNNIGIISAMRPSVHVSHPYYDKNAKAVVDSTPTDYSSQEERDYFTKGQTWEQFLVDLRKVNDTSLRTLQCPPEVAVTFCAMVNNRAIERVGYLADPQFEKYGSEDVDLSWSLNKVGYKCCIDNSVYIHHFRHKSIDASKLDRGRYLKKNNYLFFKKWSKDIYSFLSQYTNQELKQRFNDGEDDNFWFLRLLNKNIEFWDGKTIVER